MSERDDSARVTEARIEPDGPAPLRWGVIGATSAIARLAVLPAIAASPQAKLVAIASRSAVDGQHTAAGNPDLTAQMAPLDLSDVRINVDYQQVIDSPDVDAVYIPLPNGLHAEWTARAAAAGKHVLCEKPLSHDPVTAASMVEACNAAGVVLAEAYMTPFHPRVQRLAELVSSGTLGELRFARASFTFPLDRPEDHRWKSAMGGGALADVGIYCLAPILAAAARRPKAITASARFTETGVDASLVGWMDFGDSFAACIECSFDAPERQILEFVGTQAAVTVERAFTPGPHDTGLDLQQRDGTVTHIETGGADPYQRMIEDFAAVVQHQARPARTPAEAVALLEVTDELRRSAGPSGR